VRRTILPALVCALAALAFPAAAAAEHATRPHTSNMHAQGHSPNPATFLPGGPGDVNSDLAFWGDLAYNGNYDGFRVIDISAPGNPKELSHTRCNGNQGDVVVWDDILVRSWNSPTPAGGSTCDGQPVPPGFEGLHVFDVSNSSNPELIGAIRTDCGSHTATGVPDLANARLLIYNNGSGPPCNYFEIIEVSFANPGTPTLLSKEPLVGATRCHDIGVILGDVNMATCASDMAANVYDIGANDRPGGSKTDPQFVRAISEPGVCSGGSGDDVPCNGRWHSAAFSFDGEKIILGWEPGGGAEPECESTDPPVKKSAFFYDADTGMKLGQWTLPRPQDGLGENCTIHNYNIVPLRNGRDVMVGGHYQAGTWVVDFTNALSPQTLGFSDPLPLVPPQLGGAWSSYWYNGRIYESDITRGLNVFRFSGRETGGALRLDHLNPQTQEFSLG
jgi:hypothetical protein